MAEGTLRNSDNAVASSSVLTEGEEDQTWHRVADCNALDTSPSEGRVHVSVDGRFVSVIRYHGTLHCLDSTCFHAGGPLALGEIEELDSNPCLICPWHYYHISLRDGEKWYQAAAADAEGKLRPGQWKSVGRRQRVHSVEARPDGLYVRLNTAGALASDEYACKPECGARVKSGALRVAGQGERDGARSPRRSVSPRGGTPPASPRGTLHEGEDVWPADLVEEESAVGRRSPSQQRRWSGGAVTARWPEQDDKGQP